MSRLNCNAFDGLLTQVVENHLDEEAALRTHAVECPPCALRLAEHALLNRAVVAWNAAVPAVDLADRVLTRHTADCNDRERKVTVVSPTRQTAATHPVTLSLLDTPAPTHRRSVTAIAIAAAVMLAVPLLSLRSDRKAATGPAVGGTIAAIPGQQSPHHIAKTALDTSDKPVNVDRLVAGLQTRYHGFSRNVTEAVSALQVDIPDVNLNVLPEIGSEPGTSPQPATNQNHWSDDLKPVGRDVRKAFGFLREALPVSTTGVRS